MAKIKTKIEINEKELLEILAEKYNIDLKGAIISIYRLEGDYREPSYTSITIEGEKYH